MEVKRKTLKHMALLCVISGMQQMLRELFLQTIGLIFPVIGKTIFSFKRKLKELLVVQD